MLDSIFGEQNFIACCIWHKMDSPKNTAEHFSVDHDYVLIYAKNSEVWRMNLLPRTEEMLARYKNPDGDARGAWLLSDLAARNFYAQGMYPITTRIGKVIDGPPAGSYWRVSKDKFDQLDQDGRIWWGESGENRPGIKRFLSEVKDGVVAQTLWHWQDVGSTRNSKQALSETLGAGKGDELFVTPKPVGLIARILTLATTEHSIVLDSFAGSGTTAHAVLAANKQDGGDRKFILVECENYADTLTAERVRRVIQGYDFSGTQREELWRKSLTFTDLKKSNKLLDQIASIENLDAHRFDRIEKTVKEGILLVEGVKTITQRTEGLGGSFTYCTLGEAVDMDNMLTGQFLPSFEAFGNWLFHTATSEARPVVDVPEEIAGCGYLGESTVFHVWLIYRPELNFLTSREAALTLSRARSLAAAKSGKKHLVFAPAKFVSQGILEAENLPVEYAPLPWVLYRMERG